MLKVILMPSNINVNKLAKQVLKNEPKIIKRYPPTALDGKYTDGSTQLGLNSLTSRFSHFNVLKWWGTRSLRKSIRKGYETYNDIRGTPLYVQCWANVMRRGEQIRPHQHTNDPHIDGERFLCGNINVQVDGSTSTYYEGQPVLNKNGLMSFFSANTFHWTDRYEGNDERITIAFDIYNKEFYEHTVPSFFNKHHWVKI